MDYKCHDFCSGQVLKAKELNEMDQAIADLCECVGDVDTALDELHAHAQALIDGGASE